MKCEKYEKLCKIDFLCFMGQILSENVDVQSVNRYNFFNSKFTTGTEEFKYLATGVLCAFMHYKIFA